MTQVSAIDCSSQQSIRADTMATTRGTRMKRRTFIAGLTATAASAPLARAQPALKAHVIGFLHPGNPDAGAPSFEALREGLRDGGLGADETIRIEARWARGKPEVLTQLAQELVQLRVVLLAVTARPSIEAARAATKELPIVANDLESDPVASGYVESLARPGGNLTGVFLDAPGLCGKWLQQILDVVPNAKKIAVLWDRTTGVYQLNAIKAAAQAQSIEIVVMEFGDNAGLSEALDLGLNQNPQAAILLGSPLIRQGGQRIAEILARRRIPAISQFRTFPDGGGLMSYGPDLMHLYRRLGPFVARILRGARPAELPIERPTKFEFVINLKTARTLDVTVPGPLLMNADEVIE
jgi:putative tryptophan/tyrosine transport system substrate-binding protein